MPRANRRREDGIEAARKSLDTAKEQVEKALSIPSPESFKAMQEGKTAWTLDAYVAALSYQWYFSLDELLLLASEDPKGLTLVLEELWRRGWTAQVRLERTLRLIVERRWSKKIEPSAAEERYRPVWENDPYSLRLRDVHPDSVFQEASGKFRIMTERGGESWTHGRLEEMVERTLRRVLEEVGLGTTQK